MSDYAHWTVGEWAILELVAESHGWAWTLRNATRTLWEARLIEGDDLDALVTEGKWRAWFTPRGGGTEAGTDHGWEGVASRTPHGFRLHGGDDVGDRRQLLLPAGRSNCRRSRGH